MSGIVGMLNGHAVARDLASALARLDDRGYDCAGLAVAGPGFAVRKVSGTAATLAGHLADAEFQGHAGIANAGWADHDRPELRGAPPIVWAKVAVVHTGIIENHLDLRRALKALGHDFESDADCEVIPHLIAAARAAGAAPAAAVRNACARMQGEFALAVLFADVPDRILVARRGNPVVVARGACGVAVASDLAALAGAAEDYARLDDGDIAELSGACVRILDRDGQVAERAWQRVERAPPAPAADGFASHTRREIALQPGALVRTDAGLRGLSLPPSVATAERLLIVASGSSCNAALTIRGWIEQVCGLPCDVEDASEWRDRCAPLVRGTVGVLVSRSGETEDVVASLGVMRARGVPTVAVANAPWSRLARGADLRWPTEAGPELGAAATKSFTAQLLALARLGLALGSVRGTLDVAQTRAAERAIAEAPLACALAEAADARLAAIALRIAQAGEVIVIGRGWGAALAAEAALKLRQLAYVHADARPAGTLRHGALTMVSGGVPVLVLASADQHLAKTAANAGEVRAHGGYVIALAEASCSASLGHAAHEVVALPGKGLAQMFAQAVAVQLIAYHTALALGRDIDRPRNLAVA